MNFRTAFFLFLLLACPITGELCVRAADEAPEQKKSTVKPPVQPIRYIFHQGRRYVLLYDVADYYKLGSLYTKTGVILYSKRHRIEFQYEKREGAIDGVKTHFLMPLLIKNERPYVTESDFLRVIDPVLRAKAMLRHSLKTIMIDPGHGGADAGAKGPILPEKQINLLLAAKLKRALEVLGFRVVMTRTDDAFPSLADRTELCRKVKPDLYLSIHCNSTITRSVTGIETFTLTPAGYASTADVRAQNQTYDANKFDRNNYRLAYEVQKSLLKFTQANDRGVKHARFFVLRGASCPAILVECGFLSNTGEGKRLAGNEYQNKLVAAILSGIARYSLCIQK